ncbi:septal ring lytic transglycosylase RlpA family protein [Paracidovorax sp. MALMAid1276]|uniref:septal ring lytic transglycosylase RlpA family protein n=1 Tax=Paracidovorax sp. MALMAid1276 TaxID=3411631 RepID=UPI003B9952CF
MSAHLYGAELSPEAARAGDAVDTAGAELAGGMSPGEEGATGSAEDADAASALETGLASWYGPGFHRRRTASGERFDMHAMTAAHRTYAFGTLLCVRSLVTGRGVVVRVNDRGPHIAGRVVDLSRAAAVALGVHGLGLKPVEVAPVPAGQTTCERD